MFLNFSGMNSKFLGFFLHKPILEWAYGQAHFMCIIDRNNSKIYKEGKNEKEDFVTCINSCYVS